MIITTYIFAAYGLGTFGDFSNASVSAFEAYAGQQTVYAATLIPWTTDVDLVKQNIAKITDILNNNRQPVLVFDPVLPRSYADTMDAILAGLADDFIEVFYSMIRKIQVSYVGFRPIIQVGTSANTAQSYSANATAFRLVFQKLVIQAKRTFTNATFAASFSPVSCSDPVVGPQITCENGWFYNETSQIVETCSDSPSSAEIIVTPTSNPFARLDCTRNANDYYPGDSFVDWISMNIVVEDTFQFATHLFHKAAQLADSISKSKPVMVFVGTLSDGGDKAKFITDTKTMAELYSKRTPSSYQTIKALLITTRENNRDVAFFDSRSGDTPSTTTQNGMQLFTYSTLHQLFANSSTVAHVNIAQASVGSICDVGEAGDVSYSDCRPCQAGTFANQSGAALCTQCPVGSFQDQVGQTSCQGCPNNSTTVTVGTQRPEYCVCHNNYQTVGGLCAKCPRNTFSRRGNPCEECPADSRWKGSNGAPGQGCFCLIGYKWDSNLGECIAAGNGIEDAAVAVGVVVCLGIAFLL